MGMMSMRFGLNQDRKLVDFFFFSCPSLDCCCSCSRTTVWHCRWGRNSCMDTASNKSAVTLFSFHTGMFRVMGAFCSTHLQTFLFILLGCRLKRTYCINGVQLLLRNVQMYFPRNNLSYQFIIFKVCYVGYTVTADYKEKSHWNTLLSPLQPVVSIYCIVLSSWVVYVHVKQTNKQNNNNDFPFEI